MKYKLKMIIKSFYIALQKYNLFSYYQKKQKKILLILFTYMHHNKNNLYLYRSKKNI
jgi:hypothetical protein